MNTKKASPLSGSLLARKGDAAPSYLKSVAAPTAELPSPNPHRKPELARPSLVVPRADGCGADSRQTPLARDGQGRIKLSFRLDQERHLKLKLAAAHTDRHIQDLLTAALDRYLTDLTPAVKSGGCTCYPKVLVDSDA